MYKLIIKFVIIGVFGGSNLFAQSELMLNHVPSNSSNERFSSIGYDDFIIEKTISRPALTLNSFDGTQSTGGIKYGLGLKQVLQKLYRNDIEIIEIINEIKENLDLNDFQNLSGTLDDKRKIIEANSRLLQDLAFTALATYVLEKNGYSTLSQQKFGISHAVALGRLKDGLVNPKGGVLMASELVTDSNWSVEENAINIGINSGDLDPVKLTNSLSNVARAIDLYLAIENAYEDLSGNTSLLLNATDKQFWNDEIYRGTKKLWQQTHSDLNITNWINAGITGVQLHEAQAGNWPLISDVSVGLAVLGFNGVFPVIFDDDDTHHARDARELYERAIKAIDFKYWDTNGENERYNYWFYQTGGGQNYWAEGPYYFEILLPTALEFLHAHRSNRIDLTENDTRYSLAVNDPFESDLFLNAVNWHYNIATPDGNTPPLDDGNKKPIESAGLLSWSSDYGDTQTGKNFAYIRDLPEIKQRLNSVNLVNSRIVEISFPHVQENLGTPFPELYGNGSSSETWSNQVISRKTDSDGKVHYLLMNGERGAAITSGEGHEQADQMQILYYVDKPGQKEVSYLMDSGYDAGSAFKNSSWNKYLYHNVLWFENASDGGLHGPDLVLSKKRKVSNHAGIDHLILERTNKVRHFYGQQPIKHYTSYSGQLMYESKYRRNIVFVEEDSTLGFPSYFIDANAHEYTPGHITYSERLYNDISMHYYFDTNKKKIIDDSNHYKFLEYVFQKRSREGSQDDDNMYLYLEQVENIFPRSLYISQGNDELLLREEWGRDIRDKEGYYAGSFGMYFNTPDSRTWTAVAYLQLGDQKPQPPKKQIFYSSNYQRPNQAWAYELSDGVIDVFIKRASPNLESRANDFDFVLTDYGNQTLTVQGGTQFGFARLEKSNGIWRINEDYNLNISQPDIFFDANTTITNESYSSGGNLVLADNVVLTINGTVNFSGINAVT